MRKCQQQLLLREVILMSFMLVTNVMALLIIPHLKNEVTMSATIRYRVARLQQCCQALSSVARLSAVLPGSQQCCQALSSVARLSAVLPGSQQCCQALSSVASLSAVLTGSQQCCQVPTVLPGSQQCCQALSSVDWLSTVLPGPSKFSHPNSN